jgi:hypothetical protein
LFFVSIFKEAQGMTFAKPGMDCVFCACRKTVPGEMESWEIPMSFVVPFVLHKCPHCLGRFWRLDIIKLAITVGLVLGTGLILYFLLRPDLGR